MNAFPNNPYVIAPELFNSQINRDAGALEGESPYPSSFHPGLIIVAFCDGRVRPVQQDIAPQVWYKLVTPRGTKLRDDVSGSGELWMRESPLGENEF
jgi:prepilin-type processing-associated H-X9-DG protein